MFNQVVSWFFSILTRSVDYLLNFQIGNTASLGYIIISCFILGVIIDAIILKP